MSTSPPSNSAPWPVALTIAGSDSGSGAGVQADLKTMAALGVYGASAITALTAQNTCGVQGVHPVPAEFVGQQVHSVLTDMPVKVIKTGMLANAEIIKALHNCLADTQLPLVLDPVMVATSGDRLLADEAVSALRECLIPRTLVLTPNIPEAAALLNKAEACAVETMVEQARSLLALGAQAVLLKGGHLHHPDEAVDVYMDGSRCELLRSRRIHTDNTHGTGCTLASAVAAFIARGLPPFEACREAKHYLSGALAASRTLQVGRGHGPVHHFYSYPTPTAGAVASLATENSHESE